MEISQLIEDFQSLESLTELEGYLSLHIKSIRLYFYNKNLPELFEISQEFENLFYEFKGSDAFKEFERSGSPASEELSSLLIFFASIFERINPNPIFGILDLLPNSSVHYRLKAHLCAYEDVNDIRTHYTKSLLEILEYLSLAQYEDEEDYTSLIISFLVKLYKDVVIKLTGINLFAEIELFRSLLSEDSLKEKYHFLSHSLIVQLLNGDIESTESLVVNESKTTLYYPTDKMFAVFRDEIVTPVQIHPKTRFNSILLGYTSETIRQNIIEYGRADFTKGYGNLSSEEKVLLYCYFNMRKHFFTSCYVFDRIYNSLSKVLGNPAITTVFIDLGCGPLTSGLALADLHFEKTGNLLNINYIGVDIAKAMLTKAESFFKHNIFSEISLSAYATNWNSIPHSTLKEFVGLNNPIILNASYLFASDSLDQHDLSKYVKKLAQQYSTSKIYLTYQNPNRLDRNQKFLDFKSELTYTTHETGVERVYYKNNPNNSSEPSAEDVYFEILELTF